eukprot:scaffold12034_cov148-Skeletonema_menzelii.AAC.5
MDWHLALGDQPDICMHARVPWLPEDLCAGRHKNGKASSRRFGGRLTSLGLFRTISGCDNKIVTNFAYGVSCINVKHAGIEPSWLLIVLPRCYPVLSFVSHKTSQDAFSCWLLHKRCV